MSHLTKRRTASRPTGTITRMAHHFATHACAALLAVSVSLPR